ncbi:hypothetical protein C343_02018 [Cryptococcus neoformans C23]|uniref:Uncharacterized protein n=2 Tax=Cryptococcus neoformans TaxID=5207 RepID=A0A854QIC2_CRYNE|nr:hypothetical protein CNAG_07611 [Cryptococcus neoformans var. grubii H99]AUB28180.1 hypothetical protein CKF44_07611 [Cryptococcus neoformans var. grubii]OWZ33883.1 hypothetical protein C347_02086 [Cryptococcus neoformans var. grubii AD2-60a]OWZ46011.1 hypothetical protein C343_02018 [Cryptococcus neoformans var. grubii C23]OWZ49150.1 hypothetical protein C353_01920 [Cryptococcus neoformans var. grubii AD1-83a]OWZ56214.1 hypothetical protein C368_01838 [Cryptococcus neoformans var. grubii 1|eukprot:XP_012052934.1 hypothetical protein CNAG_07611 [Cryptococcus neoformans var. grubii H99]
MTMSPDFAMERESTKGMVLSWQIRSAWVRTVGHVVRKDINQRLEKGTTRSGVEVPSSGREVMQYLYW